MALHHMWNPTSRSKLARSSQYKEDPREHLLEHELFLQMLELEQLRAKRSGRRFVLMVIESASLLESKHGNELSGRLLNALVNATRATDVTGWYKDGTALGVIFTEIGGSNDELVTKALVTKIRSVLVDSLGAEQTSRIDISYQVFPVALDADEATSQFKWTSLFG